MKPITIETIINAPIEKVWGYWTEPEHITKWCQASADWHAPRATNDLKVGGMFVTRMEAKDGSVGFDFGGTYTVVELYKKIEYVMDGEDKRKVSIQFIEENDCVKIIEAFDPETINTPERQQEGWQAILNNFKKYVLEH